MGLWRVLIGRRLANEESASRKINVAEGVSAMGLDGLSSSAYGPEAALAILIPAGAAGLHMITPIMAAILVLLAAAVRLVLADDRGLSEQWRRLHRGEAKSRR